MSVNRELHRCVHASARAAVMTELLRRSSTPLMEWSSRQQPRSERAPLNGKWCKTRRATSSSMSSSTTECVVGWMVPIRRFDIEASSSDARTCRLARLIACRLANKGFASWHAMQLVTGLHTRTGCDSMHTTLIVRIHRHCRTKKYPKIPHVRASHGMARGSGSTRFVCGRQ